MSTTDPDANPYAGDRKVQVNPRIHGVLWDQYRAICADVREAGGRATLTDLVNATLHFHRPPDREAAQSLLNDYRAMLAQDPAD